MMRTWKILGLQALLAAALTTAPAVAEQNAADDKKLEDIQKQLTEIQQSLKSLPSVAKDVESARAELLRAQGDIALLMQKMAQMQRDVDDVRKQLSASTRVSGFAPAGASGRIRLMNTFAAPMTIRVNERTFRLEPGETRLLVDQPIGAFTYEVIGVQAPVTRTLAASDTYTIYVYPR